MKFGRCALFLIAAFSVLYGCGDRADDQSAVPDGHADTVNNASVEASVTGELGSVQQWLKYPICSEVLEEPRKGVRQIQSCLSDSVFHLDGTELYQLVLDYMCSDEQQRRSFKIDFIPPKLHTSLVTIVENRLKSGEVPDNELKYVESSYDGYQSTLARGATVFPKLLRDSVELLALTNVAEISKHEHSKQVSQSLVVPTDCNSKLPVEIIRTSTVLVSEAIQRFSRLHWRKTGDIIARGNRTIDLEKADIKVPKFVLSFGTADTVAKIYGSVAPGNGDYPYGFADIDIVMTDGNYSRFAVPSSVLPPAAADFLGFQRRVISAQVPEVAELVMNSGQEGGGSISVVVPSPASTRVFSNVFWIENVIWQIAYRDVSLDEGVSFNPDNFDSYGLH